MRSSSNELNTPVAVSEKCKQTEKFNTYTLNSQVYVEIIGGCEVMLLR